MTTAFSCKYLWHSKFEPITLTPYNASKLMKANIFSSKSDDAQYTTVVPVTTMFPSSCTM